MEETQTAAGLLALLRAPGIGPARAWEIACGQRELPYSAREWQEALMLAQQELERCAALDIQVISRADDRFPIRLTRIPDCPALLYVKGSVQALGYPRLVAVVGTRQPSQFGQSATETLTHSLIEQGYGVSSGLARGVDGIAHQTALASRAPNLAVLGCGLDQVYPREHQDMAQQILESGGALLAEVELGVTPSARTLTQRNRLQIGLAAGCLVAQTAARGGTMHTARYCAQQGKPLFCPQPKTDHPKNEGLRVLLEHPANQLDQLLPAFKGHSALVRQLGPEPLAQAVSRGQEKLMVERLEQWLARETELVEPAAPLQQRLM